MAEVIRIEDRQVRTPRKMTTEAAPDRNAVILMFTGIRYERLDGGPDDAILGKPAQGGNKKH